MAFCVGVRVVCVCGVVTGPLALQDSHAYVCELQLLLWLCVLAHCVFIAFLVPWQKKRKKKERFFLRRMFAPL